MEHYQKYLNAVKSNDWWNGEDRIHHINSILSKLVQGQRVVELGSRFGLYSYLALMHGAAHVTGIECDQLLVEQSTSAFHELDIPEDQFRFIHGDVREVKVQADVVLYIGLFYNIPDHEVILRSYQDAKAVLVESWTACEEHEAPGIAWIGGEKIESHGLSAGDPYRFTQYFSNHARLEKIFKNSGFHYRKLADYHNDAFYLAKSVKRPKKEFVWGSRVPRGFKSYL